MLFDTSVLERVKKRLQGDKPDESASDTQIIPDFSKSILFGHIENEAELPEKSEEAEKLADLSAIRLPQLALDESDFYKSTQVIEYANQTNETNLGSTQVIPRLTEQDVDATGGGSTQVSTQVLSRKPDQSEILAAELTHVSMTDEENELNEEAETTIDSSVQKTVTTKAELSKIEKDMSAQKRHRDIQPMFKKKAINPVQQLLDAFNSDSEHEVHVNSEQAAPLSPITSPVQETGQKTENPLSSDSEFEVDSVLDLFSNVPKKAQQIKKLSPIEEYAEKLKKQLNSSPTNLKHDMVALDDSDGEEDFESSEESDIPVLTKEQAFMLRQKFSRKHLLKAGTNNAKFPKHSSLQTKTSLFNDLRRANAKQLLELKQNNPDSELIEEIEKEEEEMGNLLEREMERVRRIRKREKLLEKAQKALTDDKSDQDYDDAQEVSDVDFGSDVPDSDIGSVGSEEEDGESDVDSDEATQRERRAIRARRVILSDGDDDEEGDLIKAEQQRKKSGEERTDDSYMFGGPSKANGDEDSEDPVMQIHSDMTRPDSPVGSAIDQEIDDSRNDLHKLFANLPPPTATQETSIVEPVRITRPEPVSFLESLSTQKSDESTFLATQVDGPLLNGTSTQDDGIPSTQVDAYSDDEDIHAALGDGRRQIREKTQQALAGGEIDVRESDDEQEENEDELKQKLALYEARIRKKELKARRLRKEMERSGMKGIVEGEAEESDDEWKGIGGMDREESDQANSEDEKMIDNNFNIDLNDEEVRKKFMEQYQIKDRRDLEKLMDDIKNHRLTKRSRTNRFDIELSDEEDEILMAYRRQKLEEQKQRLLENQKMMQSTKSEKSKAFFECIQEEPNIIVLDESEYSEDEAEKTAEDSSTEESPLHNANDEPKTKKNKVLEESFVQKQLSFLSKTEEDEYITIQKVSDAQHGVDSDGEDVSALKKRCLSNLYSRPGSSESLEQRKRPQGEILTDEDADDFTRVFKKPSMVSSFRTFRDKNAAQVSTGSFSGVTVNKHYKVASASKASITYMSKPNKSKQAISVSFKSSKTKEIEERVDRAKMESRSLSSRDNFA
ncbi:mediator of replication checkpoint protein 1 [Metschnikowia aff. pulcherrima]|uniref:Mediator of replication checkpoint protein 1 n=1 Tax=Metschnikowia aff. pulcherrima TaxID=2163413 RepID=A0A4P6XND7_9ASCO|nr:mediator of replication checkpoint protein 1 [Metschnikowia aff. pulcherrima]